MNRPLFLTFFFYFFFVASPVPASAENQTWKVRPGDNLEGLAMTLDIPREQIKKHNPGVVENHLQIGQKLKLPLLSYLESRTLQEELSEKEARIGNLESKSRDLERQIAAAESQLRWQPIWFWGFWIFFAILAFIASGAYWLIRKTHPRVLEEPRERSIRDLKESQRRVRSSFAYEEPGASTGSGQMQLPLKRSRHAH